MYEASGVVRGQLRKGEEVLWSGRPDRAVVFSAGDLILVPASLLWSAMALSFAIPMLSAARTGADAVPFVVFFAVPFILMAFYFTVGRLIFRLWVKSRTQYLVTNERVLALSRLFGNNVHASFLDEISEVHGVRSMRGTGTLWFGDAPRWMVILGSSALDSPFQLPGTLGPVVFYDIREADRVRQLVTKAESRE